MLHIQLDELGARSRQPAELPSDDPLRNSKQVRGTMGGISSMTLYRWRRDPRVNFPPPDVTINGRDYWLDSTISRTKVRLIGEAS